MGDLNRRKFLKNSSIVAIAGRTGFFGCSSEKNTPNVNTSNRYECKLVTTWPPGFKVLGEGVEKFADWVDEMSNGELKIQVLGAGELVPALKAFDAVRRGVAEMSHGASYYWANEIPGAPFFASVPFGMNGQQMNAWISNGGGLKLWEQLYEEHGVIPMPAGNTGMQMGGWFNKIIDSPKALKGLKMRIPGLGGKVIERAGGSAFQTAGGDIYAHLEKGVIDAAEWIGPYHDYLLGLHKAARYYYYPGWHEPGLVLELSINKNYFDSLPRHLRAIVRTAASRLNSWIFWEFESKNNDYLEKLKAWSEEGRAIRIMRFPEHVIEVLRGYAKDVIEEIISDDNMSREIYDSFRKFKKNISSWAEKTEEVYYSIINQS